VRNFFICSVLTFVAGVCLTACSGIGALHSTQSFLPSASLPGDATSPCDLIAARYFFFHGSCVSGVLPAKGKTYALGAYKGITVSVSIPQNNGKGAMKLAIGDAIDSHDVTGGKLPKYPKDCGTASCPGEAFLYLQFNATGTSSSVKTTGNTVESFVDAARYPGKACGQALFTGSSAGGTWTPLPKIKGRAHGRKLTFSFGLGWTPGPAVIAVFCD
jgi:hypothetical protein